MTKQPNAGSSRLFIRFATGFAILAAAAGLSVPGPSAVFAYDLANAQAPAVQNQSGTEVPAQPKAAPPVEATTPPPPGVPGDTLSTSVSVLIRLFVLAVILESALAVIYNWRPYLATFETRTTNPLITFFAALALVWLFNLDQVGALMRAYGSGAPEHSPDGQWASIIVTALVVAGGSSGVNRMLRSLGYRSITLDEEKPKPPRTEAWLAVIDTSRTAAEGSYDILTRSDKGPWAVIGSLKRPRRRSGILQWLLRNPRRFPSSGGLSMPINTPIEVAVQSRDSKKPVSVWGPNALAPGAILDVPVDLAKTA
jgi:hypothetical protein